MKKWAALIFLVATAFAQQTNQDFWPASPGLNLGKSNQRWNANINNINITGTCTINGASCLGSGTITGATNNGGLVATGHTLGLLKTCSTGQILSWNGTAWHCTSAGSGLPAGLDTQIQVNSSGGFGASPNFTFNLGTSTFSLSGTANISGPLTVTGALTNSALGPGGPFCVQETNGVFSSTGIACGSGGGSIGPGTTNKLTLWTSSTTVGNSDLTQSTGVSISTSDRIQINSNYLQASLTSATGCTIVNPALGLSNNPSCYSVFGLVQLASGTNSSSGILAGLYGTSSSGIGTVTGSPYIVGVYGLATAGGTGAHSWVAGLVGQSNTNNTGTVNVSSGVVALGETGAFGAGGGSATLLDGLDAQIQIQHASETSARTAGVYVRSPVLTGASTHNYGMYIEDQTVGAGNNTDPWGIFEAGSAKNQLGGSLTLAGIVGSTQCLHVNSAGLISGTGADCGSGSSTFPSGTGIPQVVGGSSWGSTLSTSGSGNVALTNSAVFITPNLGTPSALVLTNATGAPTWNQNTTGTAGGLTGCTQAAAGDVCVYTGSAWQVFTGNNSGTAVFQEDASGVPSWGSGASTTFQANGTPLSSASTVNFLNSSATNGLTLTFTNTSAGNVKLGFTGTLTNAGLTNSATTVNGQTCTLGSTCTIPEQVNTVNMTSQAGFNLLPSTTNAVALTVTPVNSATNAIKFEITGGSYSGNAAGLFGTPSITVNALTATTINGTTWAGTWAGSPTISGNPTFSGSPVFSVMGAGGPFCVQETGGVLSSTGVACGSGGGSVGPGTVNGLAYFNASSTVASVSSVTEGQIVVFHHTGPPTAVSQSFSDNSSGPIITSPYVVQCDNLGSTILDRGTSIPFGSGSSVITVPDSTGSGCSGLSAVIEPIGVSLTLNASGSDHFRILGNGPAQDCPGTCATTVTITDGEYATIQQSSAAIWTIRFVQGGSVTSVATGSGLTGGPISVSGTISIPASGVTNGMLSGNITLTKMAAQAANSVVANFTSGSASPVAYAMASCSGNNNGEIYTTNTGLGCGTNFAQLNVAQTQSALYTFGTNISIGGVTATGATGTGKVVFDTSPTVSSATLTGASTVVPSGATLTIQSGGSLVCAGGSTCPTGTGTVTNSGTLTNFAIVTGAGTTVVKTPATTSTLDASGNMNIAGTFTAAGSITFPFAGASGVAGVTISGAPFTGAIPLPQVNLTTTGSAACTWSANGVFIGVCPATGFTGNALEFHAVNGGATAFAVDVAGNITIGPGSSIGSTNTGIPTITFLTSKISINQPLTIAKTTNQIVTGTSTNLTTLNFPIPSGGVTLTFQSVSATMASLDVAETFTALKTFGANASIGSTAHGILISENTGAVVASAAGTAGQCMMSNGASSDPTYQTCPGSGAGTGTVTSVGLLGTSNQITVTGASPITTSGSWTLSLPSSVGLGTDGSVAGTLVLSNSAAAFHNTISSGATANNTIKLFATVPTNGDMFYCVVASTTCTMTDANFLASNVVLASAPGVGIAHFAGSTQTLTSSLIVAADITSGTITGTQVNTNLKTRAIPFNFGAPEGSALSTGLVRYITVPYGCTINGYDISADSGTATIKFWKVATGTALPTVSNVISTSGVQLTTGTTVRSSTTSDFTTTTITAGDILAATNTATSAAKFLQAEIECTVP